MIWTTFDFFRSVLINCINILKFKQVRMNWWGIQGDGVICFSLENISSLSLLYIFIHFVLY